MGVNWLYRRLEALFSPDFVQTLNLKSFDERMARIVCNSSNGFCGYRVGSGVSFSAGCSGNRPNMNRQNGMTTMGFSSTTTVIITLVMSRQGHSHSQVG